jgi:hypothetical protein
VRIWSLHPKYLDARGLVALWRETLLAQAVLLGKTKGYIHHPQLDRFRQHRKPVAAIATYLRAIHDEATERAYRFAADKIEPARPRQQLTVTRGQLDYEWQHLMAKLRTRDPARAAVLANVRRPLAHPLFRIVRGDVATWEKAGTPQRKKGVLR